MQIHNLIKTSMIDYPGKLACVVFTQGCMWKCWYCQNAELLPIKEGQIKESQVFDFLKTRKGQLDGVVLCGGEPTLQKDLAQFALKIKELGFLVKLDTNGTNPVVLKELLEKKLIDYVAMDIKTVLSKYDDVTCIKTNLDAIKESINILKNSNIDYEFRTTAIPTISHDDFIEIAKMLKGAKHYYIQTYVRPSKNHPQAIYAAQDLQKIAEVCKQYVPTSIR